MFESLTTDIFINDDHQSINRTNELGGGGVKLHLWEQKEISARIDQLWKTKTY